MTHLSTKFRGNLEYTTNVASKCNCVDFNYEILAELNEEAIIVCEHDQICFVNSNAVMLSGWSEEELLGREIEFLLPEFHQSRAGHTQLNVRRKTDDYRPALASARTFLKQSRTFTAISLRDLAELTQSKSEYSDSVIKLTGSMTMELMDLLSAILINGQAGLEWLGYNPPNVPRATKTMESLLRNGTEVVDILSRLRVLIGRTGSVNTLGAEYYGASEVNKEQKESAPSHTEDTHGGFSGLQVEPV
jgi:PAS domain S-box-containing protein